MGGYIAVLKNYMEYDGRASRAEFWSFAVIHFIIMALLALTIYFSIDWKNRDDVGLIPILASLALLLYFLGTFIPTLAAISRRLHDIDRSAGFLLLAFVPTVGHLILFILMLMPGRPTANRFGEDPYLDWDAFIEEEGLDDDDDIPEEALRLTQGLEHLSYDQNDANFVHENEFAFDDQYDYDRPEGDEYEDRVHSNSEVDLSALARFALVDVDESPSYSQDENNRHLAQDADRFYGLDSSFEKVDAIKSNAPSVPVDQGRGFGASFATASSTVAVQAPAQILSPEEQIAREEETIRVAQKEAPTPLMAAQRIGSASPLSSYANPAKPNNDKAPRTATRSAPRKAAARRSTSISAKKDTRRPPSR